MSNDEKLFEFEPPIPHHCIEYDPRVNLGEDDWFKVSNFRSRSFCLDVLKGATNSADFPEINKDQFDDIVYLMSVQDRTYFFQRVLPSRFIRRKTIVFGDRATLEPNRNRIVVYSEPDAIFLPDSDALLFRKLVAIAPVFKGIDQLFKDATDEQVDEFLNSEFMDAEISAEDVSKPNRKRIALALEALNALTQEEQNQIFDYSADYLPGNLEVDRESRTVKIVTDNDLKSFIFGIEQRYYTTPVGAEKRLANSVIKM